MNLNWYLAVLKKYATFEGRAGREEFWVYALFNFVISFVLYLIAIAGHATIVLVFFYLFSLAVLLPSLAVGARRLHDTGKSAWYLLLEIVPFGAIVLIVFWAQASQFGPNAYGAGAPTMPGELVSSAPMAAPVAWSTPPTPPVGPAPLATSSAAYALDAAATAFCTQCGTPLRQDATFCTSCGARTEAS